MDRTGGFVFTQRAPTGVRLIVRSGSKGFSGSWSLLVQSGSSHSSSYSSLPCKASTPVVRRCLRRGRETHWGAAWGVDGRPGLTSLERTVGLGSLGKLQKAGIAALAVTSWVW